MKFRCIINIFSVSIHIWILLLIYFSPSLRQPEFDENLGDIAAVLLRVSAKYAPVIILRDHTGIVRLDRDTFPLATVTNACEWYVNYVIIMSALAFSADRAVMAISFTSYPWFCNRFFKWILVMITWTIPIVWILPMFTECCRSSYIDNRVDLLEMEKADADMAYDAIDMILEMLFYLPVMCMLNTFTTIMLYNKWSALMEEQEKMATGQLPSIQVISNKCTRVDEMYTEKEWRKRVLRKEDIRARLELELSFAMMSILDMGIDFLIVLFYSLYWASYMNFIAINYEFVLEAYYYTFEIGNLVTPYIILLISKAVRIEFFKSVKSFFSCHRLDNIH